MKAISKRANLTNQVDGEIAHRNIAEEVLSLVS